LILDGWLGLDRWLILDGWLVVLYSEGWIGGSKSRTLSALFMQMRSGKQCRYADVIMQVKYLKIKGRQHVVFLSGIFTIFEYELLNIGIQT
jgi:hypothetical protein